MPVDEAERNSITIVLASHNEKKAREMQSLLPGGFRVVTAGEIGLDPPEETGTTFAENALIKARATAQASGFPAVADDSGLVIDALDGLPGVRSARFASDYGRPAGDDENNRLVLEMLNGKIDRDRTARFVSAVALVTPVNDERVVYGTVKGHIGHNPAGTNGFGYDPIFLPEREQRTMAQLTDQEKNEISHRSKAFRKLTTIMLDLFEPECG